MAARVGVHGDVTVDWLLLQEGTDKSSLDFAWVWGEGLTCRMLGRPGGAAFTGGLVEAAVAADATLRGSTALTTPAVPPRALTAPAFRGITRTFSIWTPLPRELRSRDLVWRMSAYLGEEPASASPTGPSPSIRRPESAPLPPPPPPPDHLLIHDLALGFRGDLERWQHALRPPGEAQTIILATIAPGPLWERLVAEHAANLTVVVTGEDLRKEGMQVSYPLSWEQVLTNVTESVRVHDLSAAARVVVVLGAAGAVLVEKDGSSTLVFDPLSQEGDWVGDYPGLFWGFSLLPCTAAALLVETLYGGDPDPSAAALRGLETARALHVEGYGEDREGTPSAKAFASWAGAGLGRPPQTAGEPAARSAFARFTLAGEAAGAAAADFSILLSSLRGKDLLSLAREAALVGPVALAGGIPVESAGGWVSVDRAEIESVRSVRNIIREYVRQYRRGEPPSRPLSIGVFGPPGAGKSFAVGEIGRTLLGDELTKLTFNLSQFQSVEELPAAFHQIRDLVLEQKLPFVFWDEFDAELAGRPLGWLSSFLAPMQDGDFRESGTPHPIGPAVFIFAGGTSATLAEFVAAADEVADRRMKKPDFVSRLRGYLNILGPNRASATDVAYPLRRAFLLRSLLMRKAPQTIRAGRLSIDDGVLGAFLRTERFVHGARSVEAIIDQSSLAGKARYGRSSLPPADQLSLHVDAEAFLGLLREEH
ncbi:MAG: P-loop NTPase family protein [Thermoleophilia bacterium]